MDKAKLLAVTGGNRALLREMARLCLEEDAPRLRAQLHVATESGDNAGLESAAHALKGLVAEFRAESARAAAAALETAARTGARDEVAAQIEVFEREFETLAGVLRSLLEEPGS